MRFNITDKKNETVSFLYEFLLKKVNQKSIRIILNGKQVEGIVNKLILDEEKYNWIRLEMDEENFEIPFTEGTTIRFDRSLFYFETSQHHTLIYV
jgi:hypothetical protein